MPWVETQPFNFWRDITKSDTVNFVDGPCDAIYAGGAGVVVAVQQDGTIGSFTVAAGGPPIPIKAIRVNNTDTTASLMVALYVDSHRHLLTVL